MSSLQDKTFALNPHPQTPSQPIRQISARVARTGGMLAVTYVLQGDLERVRIPEPAARCVTDKLWQHTCCEIFISRPGMPAYHEFNLSPSGEWAVYAFERYREPRRLENSLAFEPMIGARRSPNALELDAALRLETLSPEHARAALSIAVSVVVEGKDGKLSYWALSHPPGQPDFHHRDAFVLELDEIRH